MEITVWQNPANNAVRPAKPIQVTKISCVTDEDGNCDIDSNFINGRILKLTYDKGTVTATTTAVITFASEQIDSYNVNTASAHRYPRVATVNCEYVVSGAINVKVTGGQENKSFDIYIYSW